MEILELNVNEESKAVGADRTVAVRTDTVVSVEQVNTKVIVTCQFGSRLTKYTEHFNTWQAAQIRYEELLSIVADKPVVPVDTSSIAAKTNTTNTLGWSDESIAAALMRCAVEISSSANIPAQVFCEYSGHVKCLVVNVYIPGWSPNAEPDFHYDSQEGQRFSDVYKNTYTVHDPKDMLWILQRLIAGARDGAEAPAEELVNGDYVAKIAADFEDYKSENRPMRTARLYADGDVYADTATIETVDKENEE